MLFENKDYYCQIVPPNEFVLSNPVIVGEKVDEDISSHWFIVGHDGNGDYVSIDLHQERSGTIVFGIDMELWENVLL
ncbi:hypothetical protein J2T15_006105 [Paenibacillus harenae]|uniref:SMI1/KNR4 family protein n=1 Tax=Paenibacillus harenae TaxID=306543 RepID=A0ABT9UAF4_PAEHA|nr:hypothetical protein [Paenibacillus harenae]